MTGNSQLTLPSPDGDGSKTVHIQIGKHLDLRVSVQMSPAALSLLLTILAGLGGSLWGVMHH
ncbi:hypothetical protein [Streptomyces sasae]|uniref:hypothetical protein n=1 Tax=Streptomyces sasae TaxID=1266772 RepID=UPI00292F974B|nr:hypothetical protein [Streptomyces sasae]